MTFAQATMKFVSSCKNKIDFCVSERSSDRFSLVTTLLSFSAAQED
jgi:hypothetical protein